jgi:kynurenine formamidase
MCEQCDERGKGWLGWSRVLQRSAVVSRGPWIDLSYPIGPEAPCASIYDKPSLTPLKRVPIDPFNVTELRMVVHAGTHVDSPRHYYLDGPAFEDVPLERLYGPGVVWHIPAEPEQVIGPADLERARPALQAGDILALDTGWTARFGTGSYDSHPSLSSEAADWLVERGIKLLACDFATPDLVYCRRQPGFEWPVHRTLLSRGILICEHLRAHPALRGKRVDLMFNVLNITGSDGAPARVLAREAE